MGETMKNEFPNGVWPVMLTPYTEDNKIDYPALEKLTEWYFENGCDGLFAVCQSSEMFQQTLEERCKIAAAVKKYANGKPVIASGHISDSMEESGGRTEAHGRHRDRRADPDLQQACRTAGVRSGNDRKAADTDGTASEGSVSWIL